jgi:hypothetical protein
MYCKCCTPFSGTWRNRERFVAADTTHGRNALLQNSSVLAVDTVGSEPPRAPNRPARRCVGHGCSSGKVVVEHVRRREVAFGDLWVVGDPCGCRVSRKRLPAVGVAAKVSACQPTSCGRLGCLRICAEHLTLAECETLATEGDATCMRMIAVLDRPRVIGLVDEYWVQRHDNTRSRRRRTRNARSPRRLNCDATLQLAVRDRQKVFSKLRNFLVRFFVIYRRAACAERCNARTTRRADHTLFKDGRTGSFLEGYILM